MPKTYTVAVKENALKLCDEIGASKASEQTGITQNTLYAWRRAKRGDWTAAAGAETPAAGKERVAPENGHEAVEESNATELIRLQIENGSLKAQIETCKNALRAFTE